MVKKKSTKSIVSLKIIMKITKKRSLEEIGMIPLECANCGHKDILLKFIKKYNNIYRNPSWGKNLTQKPDTEPVSLKEGKYEPIFYCPKCHSSYIVCDKSVLVIEAL